MISIVADKQIALEELCVRFRVKSLELFGSGANDDFNLASSDGFSRSLSTVRSK